MKEYYIIYLINFTFEGFDINIKKYINEELRNENVWRVKIITLIKSFFIPLKPGN